MLCSERGAYEFSLLVTNRKRAISGVYSLPLLTGFCAQDMWPFCRNLPICSDGCALHLILGLPSAECTSPKDRHGSGESMRLHVRFVCCSRLMHHTGRGFHRILYHVRVIINDRGSFDFSNQRRMPFSSNFGEAIASRRRENILTAFPAFLLASCLAFAIGPSTTSYLLIGPSTTASCILGSHIFLNLRLQVNPSARAQLMDLDPTPGAPV